MSLEGDTPLPECLAELSAQGEGEEEVDAVIRCGRIPFFVFFKDLRDVNFLRFESTATPCPTRHHFGSKYKDLLIFIVMCKRRLYFHPERYILFFGRWQLRRTHDPSLWRETDYY